MSAERQASSEVTQASIIDITSYSQQKTERHKRVQDFLSNPSAYYFSEQYHVIHNTGQERGVPTESEVYEFAHHEEPVESNQVAIEMYPGNVYELTADGE